MRAHVGRAMLLVNRGPPPSLHSALHLGLHRQGKTTGRGQALPQFCRAQRDTFRSRSPERNTSDKLSWSPEAR
jgi:hypothetical protein